ncbi:hypothetical protein BI001_gp038 [Bacillus phage Zuko]|uniref:hypothetical protein n=1 Tax=Bacillus phage Zuko TaxID=1805956 RepID=UPI0007A776C4|nr:hypothetical protein BI001_gp038 [Bacillus phage Zuko]AMW62434.1 hypothetical protein ZUKO_38 [Bacillus phage Zuko]
MKAIIDSVDETAKIIPFFLADKIRMKVIVGASSRQIKFYKEEVAQLIDVLTRKGRGKYANHFEDVIISISRSAFFTNSLIITFLVMEGETPVFIESVGIAEEDYDELIESIIKWSRKSDSHILY